MEDFLLRMNFTNLFEEDDDNTSSCNYALNWTKIGFVLDSSNNSHLEELSKQSYEFWQDLNKHSILRFTSVAVSFFTSIFAAPAILNIIQYNQNRHIRTILHHMETGIMWHGLFGICPIQLLEGARLAFGPIHPFFCQLIFLLRNSTASVGALISLDALVIFRYLFIFVFKNFAPLDEDFFARFLHISIGLFTLAYALIFLYIPGKMPINYYICTGQDPSSDPYDHKKFAMNAILPALSLLCYFTLSLKIRWHKRKLNAPPNINVNTEQQENAEEPEPPSVTCYQMAKVANKSTVANFGVVLLGFMMMTHSLLFSLVINKMTSQQIMSDTLSSFLIYAHLSYISFYFWGFMAISYYKNPDLRTNFMELFLQR